MLQSVRTVGLLALLSSLLVVVGQVLGNTSGLVIGLVIAVGMNFFSWFFSGRLAVRMSRAKEVDATSAPQLHGLVTALSTKAGKPMPRLYVAPSPQLNAFASGRGPANAVVCVNQGLLDSLTREEVEGVIGHELQHVYNRDILVGSVAATIGAAITFVSRFGLFMGGGNRRGGGAFGGIAALATVILGPLAAIVIQAAVTRSRESLADQTGVELTGNPLGLARALAKLERGANDVQRLRAGGTPMEANPSYAHLYIAAPFGGRLASRLFSTHPPIQERIRALGDAARQQGQIGPGESIFDHL